MTADIASKVRLTAIVPVTNLEYRWAQISRWVHVLPKNIGVIFVHDTNILSERNKLHKLLDSIPHKSIEILDVDFLSPGLSRNFGLARVSSEYVCFWDSDDLPIIGALDQLITNIPKDADLLVGQYRLVSQEQGVILESSLDKSIQDLFMHSPGVWRMIFRTESIKDFDFPNLRLAEDQIFLVRLNLDALNVVFTKELLYEYSMHNINQLTNQPEVSQNLIKSFNFLFNESNIYKQKQLETANLVLVRLFFTLIKRMNATQIMMILGISLKLLMKLVKTRNLFRVVSFLQEKRKR